MRQESGPRRGDRVIVGVMGVAVAAALIIAGCGEDTSGRPHAERIVLERELANLDRLLEDDFDRPLAGGDLLVVIHQDLVQDLLTRALPLEGVIDGRYGVRLEGARAELRTGLASIELDGRVFLADRPDVVAEVTLHGALEVSGISGSPPMLEARPEVLAIETRRVGMAGLLPGAEGIVAELASRRLGELNEFLGVVQLPVAVESDVRVPGLEEDEVTIPPAALQLGVELERALVADQRLWILVALSARTEGRR